MSYMAVINLTHRYTYHPDTSYPDNSFKYSHTVHQGPHVPNLGIPKKPKWTFNHEKHVRMSYRAAINLTHRYTYHPDTSNPDNSFKYSHTTTLHPSKPVFKDKK